MFKKIIVVLSIVLVLGFLWGIESTYTRQAKVISIDNGVVSAKDNCGYVWQYKGTANIGDEVVLVMNDNHTSKITDDIVKGVK